MKTFQQSPVMVMSERYKKPSGTSCEQAASAKPPLQVTATEMKHFEDHDILLKKNTNISVMTHHV